MKIAIIGPNFFGYCQSIAEEISKKENTEAVFFDEIPTNTIWTKILIRLRLGFFLKNRINAYHEAIKSRINSEDFDILISFNSESLTLDWLSKISVKFKLFYMWDSLLNKPVFRKLMNGFDSVATFDPNDSKKLGISLVHLFAEKEFNKYCNNRDIEYCFVGTMHSIRLKHIYKIEKRNKVIGHFYYFNKLFFIVKELSNFRLVISYLSRISTDKWSKSDVAECFSRSKAVIDITHPKQAGLTSRTFESLSCGCYLYTNNVKNVLDFVPSSLHKRVLDVKDLFYDEKFNPLADPLSENELYWLSIDRFIDDILRLVKI